MTRLLHLESMDMAYVREFEARVGLVRPDWVELDQSAFYPQGGGQDWDTGTLVGPDGGTRRVTEVTKRGPVKHVVGEGHGLREGDVVRGAIDWPRRHAHMRMHTAQHLVSGLAYEMFAGARTVGNQIHQDRSRIDLRPFGPTRQALDDLEDAANNIIRSGLPVTARSMRRAEVEAAMGAERTNMDLLPRSVTDLRVIRIGEDVDLCPCAGTHVRNTREIGALRILGVRSKGQGTQRLEYALEGLGDDGA